MSELPEQWEQTTIGELIMPDGLFADGDWIERKDQDANGSIRLLQLADIGDGVFLNKSQRFINEFTFQELRCTEIFENDILVARMPSPLGRACLMPRLPQRCITVVDIAIIRPGQHSVLPRWLKNCLNSPSLREKIISLSSGTTRQRISRKNLKQLKIPLPPLEEQKRIADKLDKLFARIDACCDRLARIPQIIEQFRQSVLADAMSGYLTEDWREENFDVHSGDSLLKNKNFSLLSSKKEELPLLPSNWEWVALGNYAQCSRGKFSVRPRNDPTYFNGKYPFIQIGDIPHEGGLIKTHKQTLNDKGFSISRKFLKGTVVIAIVGSTIGNTGILAYDMCCTDSIIAIDSGNKISNQYIELFLRYSKEDIRQISYAGGGQPNIKLQILNSYPLALPPLTEQYEIVSQIKSLFIDIDRVKRHYQNTIEKVEELKSLILDQAFRGELVPQDPNDEPASVLLESIRAERLAQPPRPKRIPIRKSAMTKQPKESLKGIIQKSPKDRLLFDDLREQFPGNYDLFKNTLFDILDETEPIIKQVFDREKELMCFTKEQK